jgi:ADP-ribosylglycohydrolase
MTISKRDRYRGAMLGVLCGDALGAPYETWDSIAISEDMRERGGLTTFDYTEPWKGKRKIRMGSPTDDSDHTVALAQSLVACKGLSEADLYARLRTIVYEGVSPITGEKTYGAGLTTKTALKPETWEESKARPFEDEYPSNGSLMRSAPLALFIGTEARAKTLDSFKLATIMSRVTHRHKYAGIYTAVYVEILLDILNGVVPNVHVDTDGNTPPCDPRKWPERGHVEFSYHIALWAFSRSSNYRDGLTKAISVGGDTDTYGAIAGGLLGAHFGIDGIPKEWREVLQGGDIMIDLADKLFDLAHAPFPL